jgi:SAM-dependent methyltransferase
MLSEDLLDGHGIGNHGDNRCDWEPHCAHTGHPAHLCGLNGDSVKGHLRKRHGRKPGWTWVEVWHGVGMVTDEREALFPDGFFDRMDSFDDAQFYEPTRLVTHIDAGAIAAVSALYDELGICDGDVLDLASSWISHLPRAPKSLCAIGMNATELARNAMATSFFVHDLNIDPTVPVTSDSFDSALCCVSIDYLIHPMLVLDELARVVRPGGQLVITFSNRCFPTKAIAGWLNSDDATHVAIVRAFIEQSNGWGEPTSRRCPTPPGGDPLFAVTATRVD